MQKKKKKKKKSDKFFKVKDYIHKERLEKLGLIILLERWEMI